MGAAALSQCNETAPLEISEAGAADSVRWNAFVFGNPAATFFHRYEWSDVLRRAFAHKSHYLLAERAGQVVGILPLAHVRSRLFSNALISTPFCVYGGVVGNSPDVSAALLARAKEIAADLGVDYLETRNLRPVCPDWPSKDLYVTFRKPILADTEANLLAIPKKQRAMVRKGIKAGLVGVVDDDVEALYRCYSESVRNLGTPVFARRYLQILHETFANDCEVMLVKKGNRNVAAVMSFFFRDEVLPYYGGGTVEARALKGNDFMYWEVMERARKKGLHTFDYGRSKVGTGSYRFKKHWGFEPEVLSYEYHLVRSPEMPDLSPNNPRYRMFIGLWQKLPLGLSQRLGPWLAKSLG